MKLVAGNSNRPSPRRSQPTSRPPLAKCIVRRFADKEIFVEVQENVRGEDVFVIQSTSAPANDHLMELLILIDALRRASAGRITAVFLISVMPGRTGSPGRGRRFQPSSSPT